MLDKQILDKNIQISLDKLFAALNYTYKDTAYFRTFNDREKSNGRNYACSVSVLASIVDTLNRDNAENRGVFFVVNGGGQSDKDTIKAGIARAQFIDFDDYPFDEQIDRLNKFPLEPSLIFKTRKSLHCYWLLENGDIDYFRSLQIRLIKYFGSDPVIQNESRVMRVPGFNHCKQEPVMVKVIKWNPELRYTQEQIASSLPEVTVAEARARPTDDSNILEVRDGKKVPVGQRYKYLIHQLRKLVNSNPKQSENVILGALWVEAHETCEGEIDGGSFKAFCKKYRNAVRKFKQDPYDFAEAAKMYWEKHPGEALPEKAPGVIDWTKLKDIAEDLKSHNKQTVSKLPKLRKLSDIERKEVEWLFPPYIPKGKVTMLCGDGGSAKTFLWCDFAAAISTGNPSILDEAAELADSLKHWEPLEGIAREPGTVLYFSSEDDAAETIKGRIEAAHGAQENILFVGYDTEEFGEIKFNSPTLAGLVEQYKPTLVIFDPLQSFIPPDLNMASRNSMRQVLTPLFALGKKYGSTFVIVCHTNKKAGVYGRTRMSDSSDIWDSARSVLIAGKTGNPGEYYLSHEKTNYGKEGDTVLFGIVDGAAAFKEISAKKDRDFVQANNLFTKAAPDRSSAKAIIEEYLADGEEHEVSDLDGYAKAMGVTSATLRRAKEELKKEKKVKLRQVGFGDHKKWMIRQIKTA